MCASREERLIFKALMLDEELAVGEVREMSREEVGKALINFRRN